MLGNAEKSTTHSSCGDGRPVPDHPIGAGVKRRTGPLAVSSANLSGQPAAVTCDEARAALGDSVAVYLDGGAVGGLGASTIVDFSRTDKGRVLRAGALSYEDLVAVATRLEPLPEPPATEKPALEAPESPAALEAPADEPIDEVTDEPAPE